MIPQTSPRRKKKARSSQCSHGILICTVALAPQIQVKKKNPRASRLGGVSCVLAFQRFVTCPELTFTYRLRFVMHFRVTCPILTHLGSGVTVSNLQTHQPVLNFKGKPSTNSVKKPSHASHKSVSILPHSLLGSRSTTRIA